MGERSVMPGIGLAAAVVAIVTMIAPWGEDERGTYHGFAEVGGSAFGLVVTIAALLGVLVAVRGLLDGDDLGNGGRLRRSHLLMAAGAAVAGPALAQALSPSVDYTSWKAAGIGGWLAAAMGVVMVLVGFVWARTQKPASTTSVSDDIDRVFGIMLTVCGVICVLTPFFGWLTLQVSDDVTFVYGALQDGLRGVGLVVMPAGVLMLIAGLRIIYRFGRPPLVTRGGLGAEHLGLLSSAAGLATSLALLLSITRQDFDETVDPELGLYLYMLAALFGLFAGATALLIPGPHEAPDVVVEESPSVPV
ncbi:MAG: hypothetical protein ACR2QE_01340 [Acidimicrobiales bacterium]